MSYIALNVRSEVKQLFLRTSGRKYNVGLRKMFVHYWIVYRVEDIFSHYITMSLKSYPALRLWKGEHGYSEFLWCHLEIVIKPRLYNHRILFTWLGRISRQCARGNHVRKSKSTESWWIFTSLHWFNMIFKQALHMFTCFFQQRN